MERCGYKCSSCKDVDNLEKQMTIYRFPKILVVHLKRFYNSTMRREKLSTTVSIPETLDASSFATPKSSKFYLMKTNICIDHSSKKNATSYKLYGLSHHSGSLYGGHYIGEVKNLDSGSWYNCNDSMVSK